MTNTLVAADFNLAADVGCNLAAQIAFNLEGAFDVVAQLHELIVGQVLNADVRADAGFREGLARTSAAHTKNVCQGDFHALFAREVNSG